MKLQNFMIELELISERRICKRVLGVINERVLFRTRLETDREDHSVLLIDRLIYKLLS